MILSKRTIVIGLVILFGILLPGCDPSTVTPTPVGDNDNPTPSFTQTITTSTPGNKVINPADVIFYNGTILTIDAEFTIAEAIAIRGDKILKVGSNEEMLGLTGQVGPETEVIDLVGQTLLPGLADGHTHILAFPFRMGKNLDEAQDIALRLGLTSVTEMWADDGFIQELLDAEASDRLRLRVNAFPIHNDGILDENGEKVIVRAWYPGNDPILDSERMLRIPGIKIFVDGAGTPGRGCPAKSEPYSEEAQSQDWFKNTCLSEYGDLYWEQQEELNQVVAEIQAAGYRVAFHAMGDRAIETALDAIEFALDGQPNELHRHQIQHSSILRDDQLERYVQMDMLSSVRGYINACDMDPDAANGWYVNRYALPGLGVHSFLEMDFGWTADPDDASALRNTNPMVHFWGLVTHQQLTPDGSICTPLPYLSQHVITVEQALRMMTYEPAYAVSQEDVLGSLEPGKFADMIILSDNPVTVNPKDLKDLEVWMTMVGGKVEYCARGHEVMCPSSLEESTPITTPTPTEAPVEPVTVKITLEEMQVSANTPVVLTFGFGCDTPEQVSDFIAATTLDITLDGQPLSDVPDYWGEIEEAGDIDEDGDVDYKSMWSYPVGVLTSGTHIVDTLLSLQWAVTDGFDFDGDGLPDEYSGTLYEFSLQIVVEE